MRRSRPLCVAIVAAVVGCSCGDNKTDSGDKVPPKAKSDAATATATPGKVAAAIGPRVAMSEQVLAELEALETTADVTCWTSFRQLDWFISEKSFTEFGTLAKIAAMKALARAVWGKASTEASGDVIEAAEITGAAELPELSLPKNVEGDLPEFANDIGLPNFNDYQKTAEHWRLVLSVIQDEIYYARSGGAALKPMSDEALTAFADMVTQLSLHLLKRAGDAATKAKSDEIDGAHVQAGYRSLLSDFGLANEPRKVVAISRKMVGEYLVPLTRKLIEGKIKALQTFNKAGPPTPKQLAENLSRVSELPVTEDGTKILVAKLMSFAKFATSGLEPMRADNYLSDGAFAKTRFATKAYLDQDHIEGVVQQLFPHHMLKNGDILIRFEPNPGPMTYTKFEPFEIRMLDHKMNGVRDSAVHWLAMAQVHKDRPFAIDPFAAEYLSEVLSMMMTMFIERGVRIAKKNGLKAITPAVANRVTGNTYVMVPPARSAPSSWTDERKANKRKLMARYKRQFSDVTKGSGLPQSLGTFAKLGEGGDGDFNLQTIMGAGVAVGDVDKDGYPDVFLAGERLGKLFINNKPGQGGGPGTFRDASKAWGIPDKLDDGRGALFVDYDGDGDDDLLVLRSESPTLLLRNEGDKFTDVAKAAGVVTGKGAHVATAFDFDRDGDLDFYIGYYGSKQGNDAPGKRSLPTMDGRNGSANQLFVQGPGGRFSEQAGKLGVADVGWTLATMAIDIENDGDLDLYLANDFGPNALYRNDGGNKFVDITAATGTGDRGSGMNVDVTDFNGDGFWDIYVTNIDMFSKRIKVVFPRDESTIDIDASLVRAFQYLSGNKFYVSNKSDAKDAGSRPWRAIEGDVFEPGDRGWGWDALFFDYDNDGDDDVYVTNGWIEGSYASDQRNQMFVRDGDYHYLAPTTSAEAFPGNSRSVAAADFDRDGDIDLIVNNFRRAPVMLRNDQRAGNRWVRIALAGTGKNVRGIGATVEVSLGDRIVRRPVSAGRGYISQAESTLTIGTARASAVDVTVRWPDGRTTKHAKLPTGKEHTLEPGDR